jgi:predicted RNA binding protein YcfA (HicA-like mRNA interferase family)
MTAKQIIKAIEADGWTLVRQESSHRIFAKLGADKLVTVPGHDRDEVAAGVLASIRRISGLRLRP